MLRNYTPKSILDYPWLINELAAREAALLETLPESKRNRKMPWLSLHGEEPLTARMRILWNQLFIGQMSEQEVLVAMEGLMREFYGIPHQRP